MFPAAADDTTVRFTWLRSFHADITIRAETHNDGRVRLHARRGPQRFDDRPGCAPGGEGCEMTRLLTGSEALRLTRAREAVLAGPVRDCRWGLDGARWIVESVDHGDYRFAHDWSPQEGAVRELGLLMLEFTGWEVEPVY